MAQNTAPIFTNTPEIGLAILANGTAANFEMTTGASASIFTAGPSGSYISKIRVKPSGSTSGTVIRVYLNSTGVTTVSGNNVLYAELSMPTVAASTSAAQNDFELPMNIAIPANWRLFAAFGTAPGAGTGFHITTIGGDY
jgi:hypothetical protein